MNINISYVKKNAEQIPCTYRDTRDNKNLINKNCFLYQNEDIFLLLEVKNTTKFEFENFCKAFKKNGLNTGNYNKTSLNSYNHSLNFIGSEHTKNVAKFFNHNYNSKISYFTHYKDKTGYIICLNTSNNIIHLDYSDELDYKIINDNYELIYSCFYNLLKKNDLFLNKELINLFFQEQNSLSVSKFPEHNLTVIKLPGYDEYSKFLRDYISSVKCDLCIKNYQDQNVDINTFIAKNISEFSQALNDVTDITFNPEKGYDKEVQKYVDYLSYKRDFNLYTNQKNIINGLTRYLKKNKTGFLISEPGTGKTVMSISVANLYKLGKNKNIFVLCPPHLNEKWFKDINILSPGSKIFVCNSVEDYINNIEPEISKHLSNNFILINPKVIRHNYYIYYDVPYDKIKLHKRLKINKYNLDKQSVSTYFRNYTGQLVNCNATFYMYYEDKIYKGAHKQIKCPVLYTNLYLDNDKKFEKEWNIPRSVLYNQNIFELENLKEERYEAKNFVSLDWYLQRKGRHNVDFFIIDEMHEFLSDSMQSQGAQRIASCAKKVLGLTGTLFNGYTDNIFYAYRNFFPSKIFKLEGKRTNVNKGIFKNKYGMIETQYVKYSGTTEEDLNTYSELKTFGNNDLYGYDEESKSMRIAYFDRNKHVPGINPNIFTDLLGDNSIFMNMDDISSELPKLTETIISCNLDNKILDQYNTYIEEIKGLNIPSIAKYAAINRLAAWVDNPSRTNGEYFNLDSCDYNSNNKLEELVKIAKHHDNECVLIYTYFDETNMVNDKILRRLEEEGIKTNILPKSIKADKRIQWFEKQKEAGVRAVICNPSAVQTGLDLLDFTTIVFYELDSRFFTLRQASRRSYRLNQKNNVSIYYMYYKNTVQESLINYMAERIKAVKVLEGDFDDEGLSSMVNGYDDPTDKIFKDMLDKKEYINDDTVIEINKYADKVEKVIDIEQYKLHRIKFDIKQLRKPKIDYKQIYIDLDGRRETYMINKHSDPVEKEVQLYNLTN